MKTATILLTGAGGAAIPDLVRHLKGLGHCVLTCDMDPHAPGLYLGDGGFVVPKATDNGYILAMMDLCILQSVDMVIPLVDEELAQFKAANPSKVLTPTEGFIRVCLDKSVLMKSLENAGVVVPKTRLLSESNYNPVRPAPFGIPFILKPRIGRGSRGVGVVRHDLDIYRHLAANPMPVPTSPEPWLLQEYIDGPEFTVSVVCDQCNTVHAVVPKEIIDKRGSTRLAVTRRNEAIDRVCRDIAEKLNPCGPFNVQLRMRDGIPYVFEINPRFSGTVNLTIAAGCDEVGGLIELALGRPYTFGEWREGVVLVRQTHDGIMSEEDFACKMPRVLEEMRRDAKGS